MLVYFFSVRQNENSSPIEILHTEFGKTIPQYSALEGGEGINYLFCVHATKETIVDICNKYNYSINSILMTEEEIDEGVYNNTYRAECCYDGIKSYTLCKM